MGSRAEHLRPAPNGCNKESCLLEHWTHICHIYIYVLCIRAMKQAAGVGAARRQAALDCGTPEAAAREPPVRACWIVPSRGSSGVGVLRRCCVCHQAGERLLQLPLAATTDLLGVPAPRQTRSTDGDRWSFLVGRAPCC